MYAIVCKSRWCTRCRYIRGKIWSIDLVNVLWLCDICVNGPKCLNLSVNHKEYKSKVNARICDVACRDSIRE